MDGPALLHGGRRLSALPAPAAAEVEERRRSQRERAERGHDDVVRPENSEELHERFVHRLRPVRIEHVALPEAALLGRERRRVEGSQAALARARELVHRPDQRPT